MAKRQAKAARSIDKPAPTITKPDPRDRIQLFKIPVRVTGKRESGYIELKLSRKQGRGLRAVYDACEGFEKLENGREVRTQTCALRFLLERIADQLPERPAV